MALIDIKILLVDDSRTMRMIIKKMFSEVGFNNIHEAKNGKGGLEKLKSNKRFDLILPGWSIPSLKG